MHMLVVKCFFSFFVHFFFFRVYFVYDNIINIYIAFKSTLVQRQLNAASQPVLFLNSMRPHNFQ